MIGLIMKIMMFLLGTYYVIRGRVEGLLIVGIVVVLWIIGLIWDKMKFEDPLYSWKQLIETFANQKKSDFANSMNQEIGVK